MPDWLKWKKPKLISRVARQPVPFAITCVCGRGAEGHRTARYQQMICLDCGEPLFVLPLNAYPAPTAEDNKKAELAEDTKSAATSTDEDPSAEPDVAAKSGAPNSGSEKPGKSRESKKTKKRSGGKDKKTKSTPPAVPEPRRDAVPVSKIKRPGKRVVTPFRLTLIAITGVLIGTVWFSVQNSRFENAEIVLRKSTSDGQAAIDNDDFLTALTEFQKAAAAADIVVPGSAQAKALTQTRDQLNATTKLSADSLIDILDNAADARERQPQSWHDNVALDQTGWMVFDANGRQTTATSGEIVEITIPLSIGTASVILNCAAKPFKVLNPGSTPQRMIFAAQVSAIDYRNTKPPRWDIQLNPESIVIWSDKTFFDSLGFELDDGEWDQATSALLSRQRQAMGIEQ